MPHAFEAEEVGSMLRTSCVVAILIVGLLAPPTVSAQDPPVFELPDVTSPGRRPQSRTATPASVSVLTAADLARLGVRTVGDALRFLPEVTVRDFGGLGAVQEVSIRGSSSPHTLILIDGVPINSTALGIAQANTIPIDIVERIEVLRGPFSAIYGSGAIGGVINIVTRSAVPVRRVRAGTGTAGAGNGTATGAVLWSWQGNRTRFSVDATGDSTGGFRPNSDFAGQTYGARFTLMPRDDRSFTIGVRHYRADQGVPGDTAFPSPLARQGAARTALDAVWRAGGAGASSATVRAYWMDETIRFTDPAFGENDRTGTSILGLEGQVVRQRGPAHVATAGFEVQRHQIDALFDSIFGLAPIQRESWVGAVYAVSDRTIGPATLLSAGLRYDTHSVYGSQLNPRVGLVHRSDDRTVWRAAIGRTFRGPSFLLLYFPGCSNPDLRPERAWSADAGVERTFGGSMAARATIFVTQAIDLIRSGCPPVNVDTASILGGSVEIEGRLGSRTQVRLNVSVTNARDGAGAPLIRVPSVGAAASVHISLTPRASVGLLLTVVGERPDVDLSTFPSTTVTLPAYVLASIRYTQTLGSGTLQVGVDNLLDAVYEGIKGFPAPGRTAFATYSVGF
jgi:vitamin B12 transporter